MQQKHSERKFFCAKYTLSVKSFCLKNTLSVKFRLDIHKKILRVLVSHAEDFCFT